MGQRLDECEYEREQRGQVSAIQLYGPYGAVRYQNGTLPTSKGFTGQRADVSTSGLDYYNARSYDPAVGQFTSADSTLAGGLSRYAYVLENPGTLIDPEGNTPQTGGKNWRNPWWWVEQGLDVVLGVIIGGYVTRQTVQQPGYSQEPSQEPPANWEQNSGGNQRNGGQGDVYDVENSVPTQTTTGLNPDPPTTSSPGTDIWVGMNPDGSYGVSPNPPEGQPNVNNPGSPSHSSGSGGASDRSGHGSDTTTLSVTTPDWLVVTRHLQVVINRIGANHGVHGNASWYDIPSTDVPYWSHTGSHGWDPADTPWSLVALAGSAAVAIAITGIAGNGTSGTQGAYPNTTVGYR